MLLPGCIFGNLDSVLRPPRGAHDMHLLSRALRSLFLPALCAACGGGHSGGYGCGLSAMAGQSLLLEEFTRPGKTLSAAPLEMPGTLPVRIALGPSLRAVAGRSDSALIVGVEGAPRAGGRGAREGWG